MLNGEKAFISGGGASDVYIVMARTGQSGKLIFHHFMVSIILHKIITTFIIYDRTQGHLVLRCG